MTTTDRQARDLPLDAHLHTDLSPDSDVPIDAYAAHGASSAASPRSRSPTTSTSSPARRPSPIPTFADRERIVRDAAERWGAAGRRRSGSASSSPTTARGRRTSATISRGHAYDFTIGSRPRSSVRRRTSAEPGRGLGRRPVAGGDRRPLRSTRSTAAARSGLFDTIGHIDVVKRYLYPHVRPEAFAAAPELYEPILRALVESGTALEVNTSGLRYTIGGDVPAPGDRGAVPRARRPGADHRLGRPPGGARELGPRRRLRDRADGRVHRSDVPSRARHRPCWCGKIS